MRIASLVVVACLSSTSSLACGSGDDTGTSGSTAIGDPPSSTTEPASSTGAEATTGATAGGSETAADGTTDGMTAPGVVTLTVEINGPGGSVASEPAGIECGAGGTNDCTEDYAVGTEVTLTAMAAGVFTGWGGACMGTEPQCVLTLNEDATVSASFAL